MNFNFFDEYDLLISNLTKKRYFKILISKMPDGIKIQRTKALNNIFGIKTRKELNELYLKTDTLNEKVI